MINYAWKYVVGNVWKAYQLKEGRDTFDEIVGSLFDLEDPAFYNAVLHVWLCDLVVHLTHHNAYYIYYYGFLLFIHWLFFYHLSLFCETYHWVHDLSHIHIVVDLAKVLVELFKPVYVVRWDFYIIFRANLHWNAVVRADWDSTIILHTLIINELILRTQSHVIDRTFIDAVVFI